MTIGYERNLYLTLIHPHLTTKFVLSNTAEIKYTSVEKLLLPFDSNVWIAILILFIVTSTTFEMVIVKCPKLNRFIFQNKTISVLVDIVGIFLGSGISLVTVHISARMMFATMLFATLILRSSYEGSLYRFLQSQKTSIKVDTLEKIVKYDQKIYTSTSAVQFLEHSIASRKFETQIKID